MRRARTDRRCRACLAVSEAGQYHWTRGVTEQDFIKQLTRRYSYHKVMEEIKKKGYTVESEEETENEQIQVRVRTWS